MVFQVDEEKLNQTRSWLMQQQGEDGCFITVGKVLHKGMQVRTRPSLLLATEPLKAVTL